MPRSTIGGYHASVVPALMKLLKSDTFDHVKAMAADGLGKLGDPRAIGAMVAGLKDEASSVRYHCVASLSNFDKPTVVPPLAKMLEDEEVRTHAVASLVRLGTLSSKAMQAALRNKDENVAAAAATVLGRIGDKGSLNALIAALGRSEEVVKAQVTTALRMLTGQNFGDDAEAWKGWAKENA